MIGGSSRAKKEAEKGKALTEKTMEDAKVRSKEAQERQRASRPEEREPKWHQPDMRKKRFPGYTKDHQGKKRDWGKSFDVEWEED